MKTKLYLYLVKLPKIAILIFFLFALLAGFLHPGEQNDKINFRSEHYSITHNFLSQLGSIAVPFEDENGEYEIKNTPSLLLFGSAVVLIGFSMVMFYLHFEKLFQEIKDSDKAIKFSEDDDSGLNTIQVVVKKYPNLALELTDRIYTAIIEYFTDITQLKATEKISFIEGRLVEISSKLVEAESEMISFLEQNKKVTSPNLSIQRTRIQRDITVYSQLFVSLSDQLELAKIDAKNSVNPIFTLDDPVLSIEKFGSSIF